MLGKNMRETAHLIDGDNEMCRHHLDDMARPLTCQVVTSMAIVHPSDCDIVMGVWSNGCGRWWWRRSRVEGMMVVEKEIFCLFTMCL